MCVLVTFTSQLKLYDCVHLCVCVPPASCQITELLKQQRPIWLHHNTALMTETAEY